MWRATVLLVALVAWGVGHAYHRAAGQQRSAAEMPPAWVQELAEIRRQVGGGPLQGSLLDPHGGEAADDPSQVGFTEAVQRLARQSPPPVAVESREWKQSDLFPDDLTPDDELTDALRRTARLLDEKANRLESHESYRQADRYRKLARRLRREARRLRPTKPPAR